MASPFTAMATAALTAVHATFGESTTFTAPPADPIAITAVWSRVDEAVSFGGLDTQARVPGWRVDVTQEAVATRPRVGTDTLTRGGTTYRIRDVQEDVERTVWVLDVIEVT